MQVKFLAFLLVLSIGIRAQVRLTEVMFRPDTLSNYTEFIEILNIGPQTVDLTGWRIGDSLDVDLIISRSGNLLLQPGQFGIILDAGYFDHATIYDAVIPDSALVLTIEDASFGRYGLRNAPPLTIFLYDATGSLVDSYRYSSDNDPGYSDEKIDPAGPNTPENWANSRKFRGTPGRVNSVTPQPVDLGLAEVSIADSLIWDTTPFSVDLRIANLGTRPVSGFRVEIIHQRSDPELLAQETVNYTLVPGEEKHIRISGLQLPGGYQWLRAVVRVSEDADTTNNFQEFRVYVEQSTTRLVINEIMFEPLSGESEWVEIYNAGDNPVNLQDWRFSDFRDTIVITPNEVVIHPDEYWVIGKDSSLLLQVPLEHQVILHPRFPTLNNDVDELSLLSPGGRLLDRVRYEDNWYGRRVSKGTSLEKINPLLASQNKDNWAASVARNGSTPTEVNSVFVETTSSQGQGTLNITPNPFSPDGDGRDEFTVISLQLPSLTGYLTCRIFDTRGRLVRTLAANQPVGQSIQLVWDGRKDSGEVARIGIYIVLLDVYGVQSEEKYQFKSVVILAK